MWTSFSFLYLWCQKCRRLFSLASFAHSYWKNWNLLSHFHYSLEYWKKIMCMNDNKSKPNWELLIFSFILLQSIQLSEGIKLMIFFFFFWLIELNIELMRESTNAFVFMNSFSLFYIMYFIQLHPIPPLLSVSPRP